MNKFLKKFLSAVIAMSMAASLVVLPLTAQAAVVKSDYYNPAENWLTTLGNVNELTRNSIITEETGVCHSEICKKPENGGKNGGKTVIFKVFRVPEYTANGVSNTQLGVVWTDGKTGYANDKEEKVIPGFSITTPAKIGDLGGRGGTYTKHHFSKSYCESCGSWNTNFSESDYGFGKDVFQLNECNDAYMNNLSDDESKTITQVAGDDRDNDYHEVHEYTKVEGGRYCQFCYGTAASSTKKSVEEHIYSKIDVVPDLDAHRFSVSKLCDSTLTGAKRGCGYTAFEYAPVSATVVNYIGFADDDEYGVMEGNSTQATDTVYSIRYKARTGDIDYTLTESPTFSEPGTHKVDYEIRYAYTGDGGISATNTTLAKMDDDTFDEYTREGKAMVEHGTAQVILYDTGIRTGAAGAPCPGHNFVYRYTIDPTCQTDGYEIWECQYCGISQQQNHKSKLQHNYIKETEVEATCISPGSTTYRCSYCGDTKTETSKIDKNNHVHVVEQLVPAPTCEEDGYSYNVCTGCGHKEFIQVEQKLGHDYQEVFSKAADCYNEGHKYYQCTREDCKKIEVDLHAGDAQPKLEHSWVDTGKTVVTPGCLTTGAEEYECEHCGATKTVALDATGHTPGAEATCEKAQICTVCGAEINPATGHDFEDTVTPATCQSDGYTIRTCKNDCGYEQKIDFQSRLNHTESGWIIHKPATITETGEKHIECTVCHTWIRTETIDKLPDKDHSDEDGYSKVGDYSILNKSRVFHAVHR